MREDRPVTVDEQVSEPGPAADPAAAALEHHVASMRRQRRWYVAAIVVVVAAVVLASYAVYRNGEITHVHSRTAAGPAPSVALATPATQPQIRWQTTDATAVGTPYDGGTVVTYAGHTVTGRDALTGTPRWTFTRTDRDVCAVAQQLGKAIALYRHKGNCDEVSTLDTGTGRLVWERTLDENGLPIDGRPLLIPFDTTLFAMTSTALYAVQVSAADCDPDNSSACGSDSWTYAPPSGCSMTSAVPGSSGVLISEHCADGNHLVLRHPTAGSDSKDPKPIKWTLNGNDGIPVAADSYVAAIDPSTGELALYDAANGKATTRERLTPRATGTGPVRQLTAGQDELIWIGGTVYALSNAGAQLWSVTAENLPGVTATTATNSDLDGAEILAPTSSGVAAIDGSTGTITSEYAVAAPPAGSRVYALGSGFLVAGSFTRAYR
jgi:outer membrane protein assembly factor BamB